MDGIGGLAVAGIVVCFLEICCGITAAGLLGNAKSFAAHYIRNPSSGFIDFYSRNSLTSPINYLFFVASTVTILAFLRLLLHVHYLKASTPGRAVAAADLAVVCVWFVFILAGVCVLPDKLDLFSSRAGGPAVYAKWVLKLKNAWVFILLAFLLWLVTLALAGVILRKSVPRSQDTGSEHVPHVPGKEVHNVQMGGPVYVQRL